MLIGFLISVAIFFVLTSFIVHKLPGLIRNFYALICTALIYMNPQWILAPGLLYLALCYLGNSLLDYKKNATFVTFISCLVFFVPVKELSPSTVFFINLATLTLLIYPTVTLENYRKNYIFQSLILSILVLYLSVQQVDPSLTLDPIKLSILFISVIFSISLMLLIFSVIGKLEEITANSIESEEMLLRSINVLQKACYSRYDSLLTLENKTEELMRQQALVVQSEKLHSMLTLFKGLRKQIEKPFDKVSDLIDETLALDIQDPQVRQKLIQIKKEIDEITSRTLNFRKIGQNLNQGWEYINVKDFIDSTISLLRTSCQEVCELHIDYEGSQATRLVPHQINSVFLEILNNNIEIAKDVHTKMPERKRISITFSTDYNLHIYIENNFSQLITETELAKTFDPFFTLCEKKPGVGMTLVFDIISQHKGTIKIDKPDNERAICHIQIPIKSDH